MKRINLIDITDLYHPYQDPGDNFDIIMPYALPEIDLKAVILDATQKYRQPVAYHRIEEFIDRNGPRDPGIIPIMQLNFMFGRNIPFAVSPFSQMKSIEDKMLDVHPFQQQGIELIINILEKSDEKVEIAVFSSVRALAAAFNRKPELFYEKVSRIHISAGASSPDFLEWNVELDPYAFICLLRSNLPIAIYPCASRDGPFALDNYNSFWRLNDLSFIMHMDCRIKRYLYFAFQQIMRADFLRAMEEDISEENMESIYKRPHNVWETAVWMEITERKLVKRKDGKYKIIPCQKLLPDDVIIESKLLPCKFNVNDQGLFTFRLVEESNSKIYYRKNPIENEIALREALADLYTSFKVDERG